MVQSSKSIRSSVVQLQKLKSKNEKDAINEDLQELFDKIHGSLQDLLVFYGNPEMSAKPEEKVNFK